MNEIIKTWGEYLVYVKDHNDRLGKAPNGLPYASRILDDGSVIYLIEPSIEGMLDWCLEVKGR